MRYFITAMVGAIILGLDLLVTVTAHFAKWPIYDTLSSSPAAWTAAVVAVITAASSWAFYNTQPTFSKKAKEEKQKLQLSDIGVLFLFLTAAVWVLLLILFGVREFSPAGTLQEYMFLLEEPTRWWLILSPAVLTIFFPTLDWAIWKAKKRRKKTPR